MDVCQGLHRRAASLHGELGLSSFLPRQPRQLRSDHAFPSVWRLGRRTSCQLSSNDSPSRPPRGNASAGTSVPGNGRRPVPRKDKPTGDRMVVQLPPSPHTRRKVYDAGQSRPTQRSPEKGRSFRAPTRDKPRFSNRLAYRSRGSVPESPEGRELLNLVDAAVPGESMAPALSTVPHLLCGRIVNEVLKSLGAGRRWERALALFRSYCELRPQEVSYQTYTTMISVLGKAKQLDTAVSVFEEMAPLGLRPSVVTYNALLNGCNHARDAVRSVAILEHMVAHGVEPDRFSFNTLIAGFGAAGDLDKCLEMYERMRETPGSEPDVVTYSSLLAACDVVGDWECAMGLYRAMSRAGCVPNLLVYNALINVLGKAGQLQLCMYVFREMSRAPTIGAAPAERAAEPPTKDDEEDDEKDEQGGRRVAGAAAARGNAGAGAAPGLVGGCVNESVFIDLDAATASGPRSIGGNTNPSASPGGASAPEGELSGVSPVTGGRERQAPKADGAGTGGAAQGRGRPNGSFPPSSPPPPRTCAVVVPDVITYSSLITACERVGDAQLALQLFRDMCERGIAPDVVVYSALVSACNKGECWQECLMVLRHMAENGVPPNEYTYTACIDALGRAGGRNGDDAPGIDVYNAMILTYTRALMWQPAVTLHEVARAAGLRQNMQGFTMLMYVCGAGGKQWRRAINYFLDMLNDRLVPDVMACATLIEACTASDRPDIAQRVNALLEEARLLETGWDVVARRDVTSRVTRGEACTEVDGCEPFPTELNEVQRGRLQVLRASLEAMVTEPDVLKPSELVTK
eukprot:jgi/Mesvir1/24029/Mv10769-RA.2